MSDYFMGQITMVSFHFAPKEFAFCNGQLLPINQNQAMFALLGTMYGGNGQTNFALPDLRGRTPVGFASSVDSGWQPPTTFVGQAGGSESVTLVSSQLPPHSHAVAASTGAGSTRNPNNAIYATTTAALHGLSGGSPVSLNQATLAPAGGTQPHSNMQPFCTINFCIALAGAFPSRD